MVFWVSVLVFIASIMTYMFYPRNDQYDQELRKAEYAINSFVNQHQAARDYMYQMIEWHPSAQQDPPVFNVLPFQGLQSMMPWAMSYMHDIYAVCSDSQPCETKLTPEPKAPKSVGHYTSVLVCLNNDLTGIETCPSNKQYLLTYGYPPNMSEDSDWWQSRTTRLETWRKAILRRTRGSASCGVLYAVGDYGADDHYYAIDTTQRLTGVVRRPDGGDNKVQYIVPPAVTENMAHSGETDVRLDTCRLEVGCTERLNGILFCLSPFNNPYYTGGLAFMVDKINNLGYGTSSSGDAYAVPLEGTVSVPGTVLSPSSGTFSETSYTISGVIQNGGSTGSQSILSGSLGSVPVSMQCVQNENQTTCSLTVNGLTANDISAHSAVSFTYVGTSNSQVLYVNGVEKANSSTRAPTLSNPELADVNLMRNDNQVLRHLRIYKQALSETKIQNNYQADKKRFGI